MYRLRTPGRLLFAILAVGALALSACSESTTEPTESTGTLRMVLVDAPECIEGLEHLYLVLDDVRIHHDANDSASWTSILPDTLTTEQRTIDLLDLVDGVQYVLGEEELPVGNYSQIRLVLEDAWIVVDGDSLGLDTPSAQTSGLKLTHGFTIDPGAQTALTLDWDACRSLIESPPGSGNWKLKPTIRIVETALTGSISGVVLPLDIGAGLMAVSADLADTAMTQVDPLDGSYVLQALPLGTWSVTAFAPGYEDSVRTDLVVEAGVETTGVDFSLSAVN